MTPLGIGIVASIGADGHATVVVRVSCAVVRVNTRRWWWRRRRWWWRWRRWLWRRHHEPCAIVHEQRSVPRRRARGVLQIVQLIDTAVCASVVRRDGARQVAQGTGRACTPVDRAAAISVLPLGARCTRRARCVVAVTRLILVRRAWFCFAGRAPAASVAVIALIHGGTIFTLLIIWVR